MQSSVQFNFQTQTQYKQFLHQTSEIKKLNSNAQIRTFSIKSNFSNKNKHNFFLLFGNCRYNQTIWFYC